MKVTQTCQLQWVLLNNPREVNERTFEGSVEDATSFLERKAAEGEPLFGHVLREDGFILANVASMNGAAANVPTSRT